MEKSRSLFQQVIGHTMLFVAFLLFATDILAEVVATTNVTTANVTTQVNTAASVKISTPPFPASSKMAVEISMTPLPDATTPGTLGRRLSTPGQPALSFKAAPPVSKQEVQLATTMNMAAPEDTSFLTPSTFAVSIKEKHLHTEATKVQDSKPPPAQKEVPSRMTVTPHFDSETVSSPAKDLGTRSQGSFSEASPSAIANLETTKSTKPKQDREGPMPPRQGVPELTQSPETSSHYKSNLFTTLVTHTSSAAIFDSRDKGHSGKKHSVIILAVVFTVLLVVGFLAFLCLRRRRHSGSTSFNSPEWAGQATLPDDTGLDKDVEQQVGSVGEGETRRGTLVTFFGKRQSRVPSIAMEDVNGKGGKEETEQLLCEEAEIGSPSEAIGDANGKVPEPLKESSPESPASNKLGESSS